MLYARDFRRTAYEALKGRWALAVGTGFIATLFMAGPGSGGSSNYRYTVDSRYDIITNPLLVWAIMVIGILALAAFFFRGVINVGYARFNKNLIDDTNPRFTDLFSKFDIFWKAFAMQLLMIIYTILWSFLFIIPGIIAAISYAMAPYILEENPSMGANEAITASKKMMYGNKWRFFCLELSFIGWAIVCAFTLGIGYLWLGPYICAANAAFYNEVSGKNDSKNMNSTMPDGGNNW